MRDLRLISESLNVLLDDPETANLKSKTHVKLNLGVTSRKRSGTQEDEIILTLNTVIDVSGAESDVAVLQYRSVHRLALNVSSYVGVENIESPPVDALQPYITPALLIALNRAEHGLLSLGMPTRLPYTPDFQEKLSAAVKKQATEKASGGAAKKAVATKKVRRKPAKP
ncbi:hypothetical protein [Paraburkholderia tuberum]|uniref:hypothetical protein n=1 Tax=Paraburkholderia TaxID=1822464 RepID=UPI0013A69054|nr:hypothetical protein [Paraburkholderia tuberum]